MTSKRLHFILVAGIAGLFIALIGGVYGANNLLTARANQLTNLKAKSQALSQQQVSLIKAKKDIKTYADLKKVTQAVVPEDKNQAEAVREIVNIAAANNVSLASVTFPASTLGTGPAGRAASSSGTSSSTATTGSSKTAGLSQLQPVKNIPGIYSLAITVASDSNQPVPYNKFVSFLSALEHNRRTAQVNTITLDPSKDNRNLLNFTLTLNEYIKP